MNGIEAGTVDMILCDLPYGTTKNKWDRIIPYQTLWHQYRRICREDGAIVLFAATPFDKDLASKAFLLRKALLVTSNFEAYQYDVVWEKN